MSVLNKMLRDLEQRQSHTQPATVYSQHGQSDRPLWLNLLLLLSAALLCFAVYAILTRESQPPAWVAGQHEVQQNAARDALSAEPEGVAATMVRPQSAPDSAQVTVEQRQKSPADVDAVSANVSPNAIAAEASKPVTDTTVKQPAGEAAPIADEVELTAGGANDTGLMAKPAAPTPAASLTPTTVLIEKQPLSAGQQAQRLQQQALNAAAGGELMLALQYWQQLQQLTPQQAQVYLAQARLWQQLSQPLQAEKVLQQAMAQQVNDADIQLLLARLAAARGTWPQVVQLLPADYPLAQYPDYYGLKATALQQTGDQVQALHWFSQLIVLQPQQARWWLGAAVALDAQGQRQQAHLHYQQALQWGDTLSVDSRNYIQQRLVATE